RGMFEAHNEIHSAAELTERTFRYVSNNPRNPKNLATPFENDLIRKFDAREIEKFTEVVEKDGEEFIYYAIPASPVEGSCLRCHGDPADAPPELLARYGSTAGFDESLGQIRGLTSLSMPIDEHLVIARQVWFILSIITGAVLFLVYGTMVYYLRQIGARERIISEKNRALEQELNEKEMLMAEIHHRVKNNLMVVQSFLGLQSRGALDEGSRDALQDSQNRVHVMGMLHERLYAGSMESHINIGEFLGELVDMLMQSSAGANVKTVVDLPDIEMDVEYAMPCGLIVNELVTNALKHAFPDGREGRISASLSYRKEIGWSLKVGDDGVGLPEGLEDGRQGSLGMKIVHALASQIQGELSVQRDGGTEFVLRFRETIED
ncbi:MAG: DUF3365 domain-containing protein, partial [Thermodesulfovibrionales bacterium]|nr:DUF3365 domain-containing protein [Thermodesulfovibrionales bacterium]